MGKRSRRHHHPRPGLHRTAAGGERADGPDTSLLDAIAAGELDPRLTALADAIHARRHLLHTVRSAAALGELRIGDHVRINHTVSPRYLHGLHGRITELDDQTATVCLHRPVGRFHTGEIRCPPLALDKLATAS